MTGRWAVSDQVRPDASGQGRYLTVNDQTLGSSVRSVEASASGQKMTVEIGRMPLNTGDTWLSSGDRSVRSARFLPSEGVMASLALGAINRSGPRPWLVLSTSRDLVSMLVSAWEPSITHILDSDHPIV